MIEMYEMKNKKYALTLTILTLIFPFFIGSLRAAVVTGAEQTNAYLKLLKGKRVALFSNQSGVVGDKLTLDVLLENHVNVVEIFSPEHGFRGKADAGEKVSSSVDSKTGVHVFSLYGAPKDAPDKEEMAKFDILVTDIQDVGLRFYTYYITMMRLMDRCAEYGKRMVILDRPNPNGFYVDGPLLDMKYASGVGALPIPVVHGHETSGIGRILGKSVIFVRRNRSRMKKRHNPGNEYGDFLFERDRRSFSHAGPGRERPLRKGAPAPAGR